MIMAMLSDHVDHVRRMPIIPL